MASAKLPLKAQINVRDNEKELATALATIATATGKTFTVQVEFPAIHQVVSDSNKEKLGETIYRRYMDCIADGTQIFV